MMHVACLNVASFRVVCANDVNRKWHVYNYLHIIPLLARIVHRACNLESNMTIERAIRLLAGFMVLLSLALTHWVHPNFIWFTVFIGANLIQSSFTGFCPPEWLFRKMGLREGGAACSRP